MSDNRKFIALKTRKKHSRVVSNTEKWELNITPIMDTENNHENKPTDKPKTKDGQAEKMPSKKIKRQATQAELDHPLHGVKLPDILESVVEYYGWKYLEKEVNILCFKHNPYDKSKPKIFKKNVVGSRTCEDIYMGMLQEETYQKEQENKKKDKKNLNCIKTQLGLKRT